MNSPPTDKPQQKRRVKRKVDEEQNRKDPPTSTKPIETPKEEELVQKEKPIIWTCKRGVKEPLFGHLFSWGNTEYRPVWKHNGPGLLFFSDCILKEEIGPLKKGDTINSICVNFATGEMELQKTEDVYETVKAIMFLGLSDPVPVSYRNG
jgi:hypothetical protein